MLGHPQNRGLLHHSMMDVLSHAEAVREEREVTIFVSYMEVYNEQVNDLLDASNTNLRIREDPSEGYYVSGLKTMRIAQIEDVTKIIALGERNRHYRQTDIHDHSSRSHTIFRILLENRSKEGKKVADSDDLGDLDKELHISYGTKYSVLNLVDLAGSERLSESGMSSIEET
jgi:centromeric protein E